MKNEKVIAATLILLVLFGVWSWINMWYENKWLRYEYVATLEKYRFMHVSTIKYSYDALTIDSGKTWYVYTTSSDGSINIIDKVENLFPKEKSTPSVTKDKLKI